MKFKRQLCQGCKTSVWLISPAHYTHKMHCGQQDYFTKLNVQRWKSLRVFISSYLCVKHVRSTRSAKPTMMFQWQQQQDTVLLTTETALVYGNAVTQNIPWRNRNKNKIILKTGCLLIKLLSTTLAACHGMRDRKRLSSGGKWPRQRSYSVILTS